MITGTDSKWRRLELATGRVLQFDHARGYGFVAADDGGEDVFLHASVFDGDPDELAPGTKMEFKVMAGDRGRKAFAAHLVDEEPGNLLVPSPRPISTPQSAGEPHPASAYPPGPSAGPTPSLPPTQTGTAPAPPALGQDQVPDDDQMCDVLSPAEFERELTEQLLSNVPSLTGQQVLQVRQSVLELAEKHGWVEA